ncbi:hypothetical protein D6D28_10346 [Aureobasidium pullulans]|uniref:Atos-like conserved domain-containing protein n=1 Tax=Aureobasidium pullulans TaxID=5580 RepID=A0A4S8RY19_AURPU|nr:hypothetical protein D6D28_10346 [Aureobasidium pullulans]
MPHSKYDSPPESNHYNPFFTGRIRDGDDRERSPTPTTDRNDIIRRLKARGDADRQHEQPPSTTRIPTEADTNALGLDILRPRSALHRGDFREESESQHAISTSPIVPWHAQSHFLQRPRAASQASLSGSFSYQPPTSPLVHQANAADMPDHSPDHFTPTRILHPNLHRHSSLRAFPYQAHQPRRSIGSIGSLPQPPFPSARRPSISDASPLQHAPMVGSYEESILRGRMSTTPSKPLDFVAQIGVLGKGDCKPSLKCPPHVAIPFPAVFYSYASGTSTDPEPSPYVGMLDLENTLKKPDDPEALAARRRRKHQEHSHTISKHHDTSHTSHDDETSRQRRQHKMSRRINSLPGGSYRIPEIGQLQIIIKNPNKTAVKLFLVPYDLSDMPPGTKTFIRQRSYSAGPVVDMPLSSMRNYGTDRPEAAIGGLDDPRDRPVLRYLIHLHICSPAKGKYYLYKSVRVVFANRVPDGKEKLRTEMQMPEPRYSAWKPTSTETADAAAMSAAKVEEAKRRRRSAVFPSHSTLSLYPQRSPASGSMDSNISFSDLSFRHPDARPQLPTLQSRPTSRDSRGDIDIDIDMNMDLDFEPSASPHNSAFGQRKDAFTFERRKGRSESRGKQESLLSKKLRDLEVRGKQA